MERLVIDRSKWLRGEGSMESRLYRSSDGKMCCIGFLALARGCTLADIADRSAVESRRLEVKPRRLSNFPIDQFAPLPVAYDVNDAADINDDTREEKLTTIFAEMGYEVEFVDSAEAS